GLDTHLTRSSFLSTSNPYGAGPPVQLYCERLTLSSCTRALVVEDSFCAMVSAVDIRIIEDVFEISWKPSAAECILIPYSSSSSSIDAPLDNRRESLSSRISITTSNSPCAASRFKSENALRC